MGLPLHARPPAHLNPECFPLHTGLDGLAGIGEKHRRYLAALHEAGDAVAAVAKRHEAADAARHAALLDGAHGRDAKMPKEITPAQRAQELRDADERRDAAEAALCEFLDEAIEEIRDLAPTWQAELESRSGEARSRREEAKRLLAEAEAEELEIKRRRIWVDRTANGIDVMAIAYPDLPAPVPVPTPELDSTHAGVIHAA
jgi:hypothetical protein